MSDFNSITVSGNLGQDPTLKFTPGGTAVLEMSPAVGKSRKTQAGTYEKSSFWVKTICFGKTAEYLANVLFKGTKVVIIGSLDIQSYQDKTGQQKYMTKILADRVMSLNAPRKEQEETKGPKTDVKREVNLPEPDMAEADIPF